MAVKLKLKDTRDRKHRRLTRKDVHRAAKRYKNWGRWGKDDEIGTLNFTTAADLLDAVRHPVGGPRPHHVLRLYVERLRLPQRHHQRRAEGRDREDAGEDGGPRR